MPWRNPKSVPFKRLEIVAHVPSEAGVYGLMEGECCVFVGDSWNLKARLLELASVLADVNNLVVVYELCSDEDRSARRSALTSELLVDSPSQDRAVPLPGISFRMHPPG